MIILGLTGPIGHGKSSFAEALSRNEPKTIHLESYHVIAEVADAMHKKLKIAPVPGDYKALNAWLAELPAILQRITHTKIRLSQVRVKQSDLAKDPYLYQKLFEHLDNLRANPDLLKHQITDDNKPAYRPILQWLGGYLSTKVDPEMWWRELVNRVKKQDVKVAVIGGVRFPADAEVIKDAGGSVLKVVRPGAPEPDLHDPTEREREKIIADSLLVNDSTLHSLDKLAAVVLKDLRSNKLKNRYSAKEEA